MCFSTFTPKCILLHKKLVHSIPERIKRSDVLTIHLTTHDIKFFMTFINISPELSKMVSIPTPEIHYIHIQFITNWKSTITTPFSFNIIFKIRMKEPSILKFESWLHSSTSYIGVEKQHSGIMIWRWCMWVF